MPPRGLRRECVAACLLGLRVRIPPEAGTSVCCDFQIKVSAMGRSLVQRSPMEYGVRVCVCVCVIECVHVEPSKGVDKKMSV